MGNIQLAANDPLKPVCQFSPGSPSPNVLDDLAFGLSVANNNPECSKHISHAYITSTGQNLDRPNDINEEEWSQLVRELAENNQLTRFIQILASGPGDLEKIIANFDIGLWGL